MNETNEVCNIIFGLPWIIGSILAGSLLALYFLSWLVQWAWAWVDDSKMAERNKIIDFIMFNLCKFEKGKYLDLFPYEKNGDIADGSGVFVILMTILFLTPPTIVYLWELVLFAIGFILLANLVRFSRRHKKLFDEHLKDKSAHKGAE